MPTPSDFASTGARPAPNERDFGSEAARVLGVDRDQEVLAIDLHAVAGIKDHGEVGVVGLLGKLADQAVHASIVLVDTLDHLEAGIAQRRCDEVRIIGGIGQGNGMDVFAVADDKRNAFAVRRGSLGTQRGHDKQDNSAQKGATRFHDQFSTHRGSLFKLGHANHASDIVASARK